MLIRILVSLLTLCLIAGCNGTDLSGYREMTTDLTQTAPDTGPESGSTIQVPQNGIDLEPADSANEEPANENTANSQLPADMSKSEEVPDGQPGTTGNVTETSPADADPTRDALLEGPREIKLLVPEKEFSAERDSGALRITFDDIDLLKVLNMQPVPLNAADYFPGWLNGLDGKRIRIRGWMYPPSSTSGISRFIFVRDNGVCCFGPKALLYDKIAVTLRDGEQTDFIQGHAFDVEGTFVIDTVAEGDEILWLYALDDATVVP